MSRPPGHTRADGSSRPASDSGFDARGGSESGSVAGWAREAYQVSERRACRALPVHRSIVRYRSRCPTREPLRRRLRELAAVRLSWGFRRLHVLLKREGWRVNHKLVYRLYTEEG